MNSADFHGRQVEIGTLHTTGNSGGRVALRLAVARLLASADLHPDGIPPQSVLVVRWMRDPLPGRMASYLGAAGVHVEWERRARQELADLYGRAARPARGIVAGDAEAVLFADEAELLACLARDIHQGAGRQRWWWRVVLRAAWDGHMPGAQPGSQGEMNAVLAQQMARNAHAVPATLALLDRWGVAAGVLRDISAAAARHILAAMLRTFRLPELPEDRALPAGTPAPPWRASPDRSELGRERAALLGVALDLYARPQEVRMPRYQHRFQAWWQCATTPPVLQQEQAPPTTTILAASDSDSGVDGPAPARPGTAPRRSEAAAASIALCVDQRWQEPASGELRREPADLLGTFPTRSQVQTPAPALPAAVRDSRLDEARSAVASAPPPGRTVHQHSVVQADEQADDQIDRAQTEVHAPEEALPAAVERLPRTELTPATPHEMRATGVARAAEPETESLAWQSGSLPTELGGVLYLINLMVFLDLPACCEEGWRLASHVGSWGLLEALGSELLGPAAPQLAGDPLWVLLRQLDSRTAGQPPGVRLPRTRPRRWPVFDLPPRWLAGLPPASATDLAPFGARQRKALNSYPPLLARWLAYALPVIAYRLRLALKLAPDAGLAGELLLLPGQLYVTPACVDLVVPLGNISLSVRMAGLDRSPGWLPTFGRAVYLHFE